VWIFTSLIFAKEYFMPKNLCKYKYKEYATFYDRYFLGKRKDYYCLNNHAKNLSWELKPY
jgi:hypothetical protein